MIKKNGLKKSPNICIITAPFKDVAGRVILGSLIEVLKPLSNKIFAITGNFPQNFDRKVHVIQIKENRKGRSLSTKFLKHIETGLKITFTLIRIFRNVDIVAFQIGAQNQLLPKLIAKLSRKRVIVFFYGAHWKIVERKVEKSLLGKFILPPLVKIYAKINFLFTDLIAVESKNVVRFMKISSPKICVGVGARYIDTNVFKIERGLEKRKNLIGYVGRFSLEKGITNFLKAIPLMLEKQKNLEFLIIGGDGTFDQVKNELKTQWGKKVTFTGWVPHEEIPHYLNKLKLLVLPSYVEGLPGIIQEAMACGTPVLATPVGGIPDLIEDCKTGFLMKDNSPKCIAENVERALKHLSDHKTAKKITTNARDLIKKEYSYERMVKRSRELLDRLMRI